MLADLIVELGRAIWSQKSNEGTPQGKLLAWNTILRLFLASPNTNSERDLDNVQTRYGNIKKKISQLENYTKKQLLGTGGGTNVTSVQPSLGFELTPSVRELVRVLGVKMTGLEPAGSDKRLENSSQEEEEKSMDNESQLDESLDADLLEKVADNIVAKQHNNVNAHEETIKQIMTKGSQKFVPVLPKMNVIPNADATMSAVNDVPTTSKFNADATTFKANAAATTSKAYDVDNMDTKQYYEQSNLDLTFDDDMNETAADTPPCKKKLLLSGEKNLKPTQYFQTTEQKRSAGRKRGATDDNNSASMVAVKTSCFDARAQLAKDENRRAQEMHEVQLAVHRKDIELKEQQRRIWAVLAEILQSVSKFRFQCM